jgi:outer membrane protein assembly factor BamE
MRILTISMVLLCAGCSSVPMLPSLKAYKIDVQQGNYITQDMVAKLKPGMTRSQVRYALGTPLIVDPFRNDRWDYFYMFHKAGELTEQRVFTVVFRGEVMERIEGDVIAGPGAPGGTDKPAASATGATDAPSAVKPPAVPGGQ